MRVRQGRGGGVRQRVCVGLRLHLVLCLSDDLWFPAGGKLLASS